MFVYTYSTKNDKICEMLASMTDVESLEKMIINDKAVLNLEGPEIHLHPE